MTSNADNPLVSVIMPAYNSEKYIRRALESVFSQTYIHYELIVVDDGSSDSTKDIILEYDDKLRYLHQSNRGASSARNYGIESSKGSLVAFLDSDDLWYPEKLKAQVDAYLNEPEAALIHTEVDKQFNFNGFIAIREQDMLAVHKPFIEIFKATNLKTPSVMIPRTILDSVGLFNIDLPTAEDKDLFLRCSYNQLVLYIPQKLVYCSVFSGSLCDDLRSYQDNIDVIDAFILRQPEFLKENISLVKQARSKIYCEYAYDLCYKNRCLEAIKEAFRSIKCEFNIAAIVISFKALIKYFLSLCKTNKT
ncbi:Putative N-acetylgalactosaminyl-diphosphoundecaprenol glucuronosyltransferase [hydrothermal vent metagenome]|uniref:N-acetylgalactosaminyl-diphosphoundecaprenol glucuronosyltransferase n=1 Tax=hydrothermal vent metagenome TaxID=652676 RepID=A0A3B0WTD8_9ZZZZ